MSWLAVRLLLSGALKRLASLNVWQLLCIALALFGAVQTIRVKAEQRRAHKVEQRLSKSEAARKADRDAYTKAQAAAALANKAQVVRVKKQQQEITDATVSRLNSRLELIRGELRKPASQGVSGSAGAGDPGQTPCRTTSAAWLCLSPEDRLRAAENEERHDELIDWALKQSAVDPNAPR